MLKTYKRETAWLLIAIVMAMAVGTMFSEDADMLEARASLVAGLAVPAFAFLAAAFGMDWMAKQSTWGGKPEELAVPTEELPDSVRAG